MKGLIELWARHLFETVRANGRKGFSRFNLWWKQEGQSIEVVGEWVGLTRLREWVFEEKQQAYRGYVQEGDKELLMKVAVAHSNLVLAGQTSEAILVAARASASWADFEARLLSTQLPGAMNQTSGMRTPRTRRETT